MIFVTFLNANSKGFISKTLKETMKINTEEFAVQKVQKVQTKFADQTPN